MFWITLGLPWSFITWWEIFFSYIFYCLKKYLRKMIKWGTGSPWVMTIYLTLKIIVIRHDGCKMGHHMTRPDFITFFFFAVTKHTIIKRAHYLLQGDFCQKFQQKCKLWSHDPRALQTAPNVDQSPSTPKYGHMTMGNASIITLKLSHKWLWGGRVAKQTVVSPELLLL